MKVWSKTWLSLVVVSVLVVTLLAGCATTNRPDNNVAPAPTRAPGTGPGVNNVGPNTWDDGAGSGAPGAGTRGAGTGTGPPGAGAPGAGNVGPNNNMIGPNDNRTGTGTFDGRNNMNNNRDAIDRDNRNNRGTRNDTGTRAGNQMRFADNIADKISDKRGINDATVMLTDNNAFVAVDIPGNSGKGLTNDLKKNISRDVKKMDKSIDNVYVSADADFMNRMGNYARDIRDGKPIRGMMDEVTETIRRVFPTAH